MAPAATDEGTPSPGESSARPTAWSVLAASGGGGDGIDDNNGENSSNENNDSSSESNKEKGGGVLGRGWEDMEAAKQSRYKEVMTLTEWREKGQDQEHLVWAKVYGLPIELWRKEMYEALGKMVGQLIKVDEVTSRKQRIDYARLLIKVKGAPQKEHSLQVQVGRCTNQVALWMEEGKIKEGDKEEKESLGAGALCDKRQDHNLNADHCSEFNAIPPQVRSQQPHERSASKGNQHFYSSTTTIMHQNTPTETYIATPINEETSFTHDQHPSSTNSPSPLPLTAPHPYHLVVPIFPQPSHIIGRKTPPLLHQPQAYIAQTHTQPS
ncbi:hypothetical protein H6P81_006238 [Aristolochia fimbriata]|uniref:DUF4283 domain-containing protein n=1 Tax=Aristolochia fimbriata TaxID=158543 RepID=A0AAV7EXW6_ARIFI|nr:hypothetical protein H6P81_006238 [Aristolochia fimbriata]